VATLIHLNGAPGVGKSTIGDRYLVEHPAVLNCDIDRLRCFIGGWTDDFGAAGGIVRPLALAMIRAHLDGGRDVLLPQMLANEDERASFRAAAVERGHRYVHILLQSRPGQASARFYGRSEKDALHAVIRGVVDADGGGPVIDELDRRLALAAGASDVISVDASGDVESTYQAVLAATEAAKQKG
jgi:predicted kinase